MIEGWRRAGFLAALKPSLPKQLADKLKSSDWSKECIFDEKVVDDLFKPISSLKEQREMWRMAAAISNWKSSLSRPLQRRVG